MTARLRTKFGHPVRLRFGEQSSVWQHDRVTVLARSGGHALCRVEWDENRSLEAWINKRRLRFPFDLGQAMDPRGDYDDDERCRCQECGGEGFVEYADAGPSYWGEDCPSEENHLVTCRSCNGTGEA